MHCPGTGLAETFAPWSGNPLRTRASDPGPLAARVDRLLHARLETSSQAMSLAFEVAMGPLVDALALADDHIGSLERERRADRAHEDREEADRQDHVERRL